MENKINEIILRLDDVNYRLKKYREEINAAGLLAAVTALTASVDQLVTAVNALSATPTE